MKRKYYTLMRIRFVSMVIMIFTACLIRTILCGCNNALFVRDPVIIQHACTADASGMGLIPYKSHFSMVVFIPIVNKKSREEKSL